MKKRQNKSKVEVVEPVSVANQCDYQRSNGKCGRALCDNFGKPCTGRSCEDWKCEAEGEEVEKAGGGGERKTISRCDGMRKDGTCGNGCSSNHNNKCRGAKCPDRFNYGDAEETPCIHLGGEDYCADYKTEKITCDKCQKWVAACKELRAGSSAVAVVAPSSKLQAQSYKARVSGQYAAIGTAKDNLMRECVKFGALLTEVSYYLGEGRGRGNGGEGLQTWLEENCPEINYKTAMGYKSAAAKFVKMIGGGSQAVAVLQDKTEVIPPGEDAPIEVDAKFIEKRDQLFNDVKSRRDLEQTYFKFMAHEGKGRQGGANKGQSGTGRRALTAEEKSESADVEIRELVGKIGAFDKSGKFRMLTVQTQSDIVLYLKDCVRSFEEQQS